jgi:hypothetical protein
MQQRSLRSVRSRERRDGSNLRILESECRRLSARGAGLELAHLELQSARAALLKKTSHA